IVLFYFIVVDLHISSNHFCLLFSIVCCPFQVSWKEFLGSFYCLDIFKIILSVLYLNPDKCFFSPVLVVLSYCRFSLSKNHVLSVVLKNDRQRSNVWAAAGINTRRFPW